MYINPIHAAHVALAQALALATRTRPQLRQTDKSDGATPDPVQLMLLSECAGRPYVTALGGLLVMNHFRRYFGAPKKGPPCGGPQKD